MSYTDRYRDDQPRWREEWLVSVAQALAMLAFSVVLRWIVL